MSIAKDYLAWLKSKNTDAGMLEMAKKVLETIIKTYPGKDPGQLSDAEIKAFIDKVNASNLDAQAKGYYTKISSNFAAFAKQQKQSVSGSNAAPTAKKETSSSKPEVRTTILTPSPGKAATQQPGASKPPTKSTSGASSAKPQTEGATRRPATNAPGAAPKKPQAEQQAGSATGTIPTKEIAAMAAATGGAAAATASQGQIKSASNPGDDLQERANQFDFDYSPNESASAPSWDISNSDTLELAEDITSGAQTDESREEAASNLPPHLADRKAREQDSVNLYEFQSQKALRGPVYKIVVFGGFALFFYFMLSLLFYYAGKAGVANDLRTSMIGNVKIPLFDTTVKQCLEKNKIKFKPSDVRYSFSYFADIMIGGKNDVMTVTATVPLQKFFFLWTKKETLNVEKPVMNLDFPRWPKEGKADIEKRVDFAANYDYYDVLVNRRGDWEPDKTYKKPVLLRPSAPLFYVFYILGPGVIERTIQLIGVDPGEYEIAIYYFPPSGAEGNDIYYGYHDFEPGEYEIYPDL